MMTCGALNQLMTVGDQLMTAALSPPTPTVIYIALTDILLIPRIESSLIALTVDMLISLKKNYDSKNRI